LKFAHIVPPKYCSLTAYHGYHLEIAPRLMESKVALRRAQRKKKLGHFVMLDNGEVEAKLSMECDPVDFGSVLEIAREIDPDEVCLPDVFYDRSATVRKIEQWAYCVPPHKRMVIPQGRDVVGWFMCLREILRLVDVATIGIPKHLDKRKYELPGVDEPKLGRWVACFGIEKEKIHQTHHIHLLGVWDNPREEIVPMRENFPWIRGIDSGIAAAYSQYGCEINCYAGRHVGLKWDEDIDTRLAGYNIQVLDDWAFGGTL